MAVSPKLYVNKPKKAQLKQNQQQQASSPTPVPPSPMASSTSAGSAAPPPPPQPPKESFVRRYKYLWPMLLAVNFSIGAYLFTRTRKKDVVTEVGEKPDAASAPVPTTAAIAVSEKDKEVARPPPPEPIAVREPIPENEQRELFKWMLEEKRKVKPKDREEKKRIDEEKAILKHFIRSKSIPVL